MLILAKAIKRSLTDLTELGKKQPLPLNPIMDIHSFFDATGMPTSKPANSSDDSDEEHLGPGPTKKQCSKSHSALTLVRKYSKKWEKDFLRLEYDENCEGAFCNICRTFGNKSMAMQTSRGVWITIHELEESC